MLAYTNTEFHTSDSLPEQLHSEKHTCFKLCDSDNQKTKHNSASGGAEIRSLQFSRSKFWRNIFNKFLDSIDMWVKNNQTLLNDEKIPRVHLKDWKKWKNNWILCKLEKHKSPRYVNYIKKVDTVSGLYIPKQVSTIFYREIRGLFSCLPTHFNVLVSLNDNRRKEHFSLF